MASTQKINAKYSPKIDPMALAIKEFLGRVNSDIVKQRVFRGIEDFCYNNTDDFKQQFIERVGCSEAAIATTESSSSESDFINALIEKQGECVFLLKDTQHIFDLYKKNTNRGFGLLINRSFFGSEEAYFDLINLIYRSLEGTDDFETFLDRYFKNFKLLIKDEIFHQKSLEIFEYIKTHTTSSIVWVDIGFQFTFSLFCYASVRLHSRDSIKQDIYNFTIYPWLKELFKGKYFTDENELALPLELRGITFFYDSLREKRQGAIIGFAIGDSLGFSIAGINASEVKDFVDLPLSKFVENKKHPYFDTLNAGQYTHNTNLFLISLKELIRDKGFEPENYCGDLIAWGKNNLKEKDTRWLGPTASKGIENLIAGISYKDSGSTTTKSCSALYRTLPLALFYSPLADVDENEFIGFVSTSAGITHNSEISKAAAIISTLILRDVISGVLPRVAIEASLKSVPATESVTPLLDKIRGAVTMSTSASDDEARKYFGTGSPVYQMLPLSIFFFLKYQNSFKDGVLAAANSFRDDTASEKQRLTGLSWEEQLIIAEGGNTDGIAAVVGSFLGAYHGINNIPEEFLSVENAESLKELATKI